MTQITATYIDHMGSDLSVVNAARVSFGKKSEWEEQVHPSGDYADNVLSDRDVKLIHYLAKHRHTSPFGHAFASYHIKSPIFVARQLVKHKFLRWNEISRRYCDDNIEFYTPEEWRGKSADKKQGSEGVVNLQKLNQYGDKYQSGYQRLTDTLEEDYDCILSLYNAMLNAGVAPEQARMVLPQSTMTEWHWSGSLDAFAAMCRLRCASDTQYETRIVADQISEKMAELFPVSWAALMGGAE